MVTIKKRCTRCNEYKSVESFHRNKSKPDGRNCVCASCYNKMRRVDSGFTYDRHCGACGAPIDRKHVGVMLCPEHHPKGISGDRGVCTKCKFLEICAGRVQNGLWVVCETPDDADLVRAKALGVPITFTKEYIRRVRQQAEVEED